MASFMNGLRDALNFLLQPPLCVVRATASQAIPANGNFQTAFDTEDIDRDGGHSTVTNTSRYTGQTPGWYRVDGTLQWNGSTGAGGARGLAPRLNGTTELGFADGFPTDTTSIGVSMSTTAFLNGTTDYVELVAYNTDSAIRSMGTIHGGSRMAVTYASVA